MAKTIMEAVRSVWLDFSSGVTHFLPGVLAAVLIVAAGWIVAWVLRKIVQKVLKAAQFDRRCANSGFTQVLTRADIQAPPSELFARLLFWLVFLSFFMSGVSALKLEFFQQLISGFFLYLPRIFSALLILLAGFVIGNFLARAALLAAVNANVPSPRVIGTVVRYLITILAFAMALEQLQIASAIVTTAFAIAFGAVMLGLAIAFGLGGRDVARRMLEENLLKKKEPPEDELHHL
jgi:uncharacterized protein YneF (UPF0154 family)